MPEPVHTYPSNHRPGTTWAMTAAWKILDALPPGVLDHATRAYLAGAMAATLMRQAREPGAGGEDYAASGGQCCPVCQGTDLERRHYDQSDPSSVTRTWRCEGCGATWTAVYTLTGYVWLCRRREDTP